jgi:hypothetical protein
MTSTITRPATGALAALDFDVKIPAQLLWGAAQFAHKLDYRGALVAVQVEFNSTEKKDRVAVIIRSCDGSVAYRVRIECDGYLAGPSEKVMIRAEHLRKVLRLENFITVTRIAGELRIQGFKMGIRTDAGFNSAEFPNLDAVWPDHATFSHNPGKLVAMRGNYLATIGSVAARVTDKGILRMHVDKPTVPLVFTTGEEEGSPEFLLMPVQLRD